MRDDERINVNGLMVSEDFLFRYIGALHNEKTKLKKKVEELEKDNEWLKNELRKEKSLREYSDSMYSTNLIVNIRFSKGEWKADVSVIEDE